MSKDPLSTLFQRLFRANEDDDEAWAKAARVVGAELEIVPARLLTTGHRAMWMDLGTARLRVETYVESMGNTQQEYTRLRVCSLPGLLNLSLRASPRGIVAALSRALGLAEIETGDAALDAAFRIVGHPSALVAELLDARVRRAVIDGAAAFAIEDGDLELSLEGTPSGPEPLVALVRFGRAFEERAQAMVTSVERIGAALDLELTRTPSFPASGDAVMATGQRRRIPLSLSVRVLPEVVLTVVSSPAATAGDFTVELDADGRLRTSGTPLFDPRALFDGAPPSLGGVRQLGGVVELAFLGVEAAPADVVRITDGLLAVLHPSPYR